MKVEIRKLTPDLVEDYLNFFDVTPHDDNIDEHKCYCVCWSSDGNDQVDFSSANKRREAAKDYVTHHKIQGYLAYKDDKVIGWCNTNSKRDCSNCVSWQNFMKHVPLETEAKPRVKSVFCFVIAPEVRRQGVAKQLLEKVCRDALEQGFDVIEAYPYKNQGNELLAFSGYFEMYRQLGFESVLETDTGYVMRKNLQ